MSRRTKVTSATAALILGAYLFSLAGCTKAPDRWGEGKSPMVLVSFPPLYCFTKAVAGDDARVVTLLAATGPHEHRANADDAQRAAGADLFLVNGLGLDDFVTNVAHNSGNKNIKIIKIAEVALQAKEGPRLPMGEHGHKHGKDDEDEKPGSVAWDPHAWLGIDQAILIVQQIAEALKAADPANQYVQKLQELQKYGKQKLAGKTNRKLIAMHESLGYFCKSFDLELIDSIMPRPGIEADLAKLAELQETCRQKDVRLIAVEPQYRQSKAAQKLQNALALKNHPMDVVEVDPMETAPTEQLKEHGGDYYLTTMRRNLDNIAAKMK